MKALFIYLLLLLPCSRGFCQNRELIKDKKVTLTKWSAEPCDNTYDPDLLKTRITSIQYYDSNIVYIVNFADNCCSEFNPKIKFYNNKLILLPYEDYSGSHCTCDCCFTLKYEIAGLTGKTYQVYFKGTPIKLSEDYYAVISPSYRLYKKRKINYLNKYGFREGIWIEFYKNGREKSIREYPATSLFRDSYPIWTKKYFPSGKLSEYERKDTSESWFGDGEIKSQTVKFKINDTTFTQHFRKYENRRIQEEYLERLYPTILKSEFDSGYENSGFITESIYKRKNYKNGQLKFEYGSDTSYSWFESGALESKSYLSGDVTFNKNGIIKEQSFFWVNPGPKSIGDLENSLYVSYFLTGHIMEIHFVRYEPSPDGEGVGNNHYYWKWNKEMRLIESPESWNEPLPWKKFKELNDLIKQ